MYILQFSLTLCVAVRNLQAAVLVQTVRIDYRQETADAAARVYGLIHSNNYGQ